MRPRNTIRLIVIVAVTGLGEQGAHLEAQRIASAEALRHATAIALATRPISSHSMPSVRSSRSS